MNSNKDAIAKNQELTNEAVENICQTDPHVTPQIVLEIYRDLRDEIKRRVDERNRYIIQLVIAVGALLTFAFPDKMQPVRSMVASVVGMFLPVLYYCLIKRSYTIGENIKEYLKSWIEPRLFEMAKIMPWQMYRDDIRKHDPKKARETKFSNRLSAVLMIILIVFFFCVFLYAAYCLWMG